MSTKVENYQNQNNSQKKSASTKRKTDHPTYETMLRECILENKDDKRGVSRPQIKKYLSLQYQIDTESKFVLNLISQALRKGTDNHIFLLPNGPSGRVKLAAQAKNDTKRTAAKKDDKKTENKSTKPAKSKPATKKKTASSTSKRVSKPTEKAKATTTKKKATSKPKATSSTKTAAVKEKKPVGRNSRTSTKGISRNNLRTSGRRSSGK